MLGAAQTDCSNQHAGCNLGMLLAFHMLCFNRVPISPSLEAIQRPFLRVSIVSSKTTCDKWGVSLGLATLRNPACLTPGRARFGLDRHFLALDHSSGENHPGRFLATRELRRDVASFFLFEVKTTYLLSTSAVAGFLAREDGKSPDPKPGETHFPRHVGVSFL